MKSKKLLFAFLLALIVCLLFIPSAFAEDLELSAGSGSADTVQAQVNGATVTDGDSTEHTANISGNLSDVVDASQEGAKLDGDAYTVAQNAEVQVQQGGTLTNTLTITDGQNVVIDLNSQEISIASGTAITIEANASLELKGNGTVSSGGGQFGNATIVNYGTFILNGATISNRDEYSALSTILNYGTMQLNSGKVVGEVDNFSGSMTISDGVSFVTEREDPDNEYPKITLFGGSMTINGGDFSSCNIAGQTGTVAPTLTVKDGKFNTIYVLEYAGSLNLNVEGGNIGGLCIYADSIDAVNFNITGGAFTTNTINFNDEEDVDLNGYIASGYQLVESDGVYTVKAIPTVDGSSTDNGEDPAAGEGEDPAAGEGEEPTAGEGEEPTVDKTEEVAEPVEAVQVAAPAAATTQTTTQIVATAGNNDNSYSIASNEEFTIKLSFSDPSATGDIPEVLSVSINGVDVEFQIAEDGTIILPPEVLAALGPGTHVITIMTANGPITMTIVITE